MPSIPQAASSSGVEPLLNWLLGNAIAVATLFLLLLAFFWIWRSTGSAHVIRARLWRLVFGKRELGNDAIDSYLKQLDQLMQFRTITRLKQVETCQQAECVIRWIQRSNVDGDAVAAAGVYFRVTPPGLVDKVPGAGVQFFLSLGAGLFLLLAIAIVALGLATPPVFRVIQTDNDYAVAKQGTYAYSFPGSKAKRFTFEQCSSPTQIASNVGYPRHDVEVLCRLLQDTHELEQAHTAQQAVSIFGAGWALLFASILWRGLRQASAATRLQMSLRHKAQGAGGKS